VADVSVQNDGHIKVHRVVCAVDCGFAVNPDTVAAQVEGGIAFGLTAALKSAITIEHGHVAQTGFRDFSLLTIAEMPRVDVHIVPSREEPSGAGECGVPPIAPAVANAVFAATGQRIRSLPIVLLR
jgi:CO/xanthine dehydrogenase Mo-binding subunit